MSDDPKVTLGDLDFTTNTFVFTMSREQAIDLGHAKPTPEEVKRFNAESRERWERSVAQWEKLDATLAELAAITEPLARKVLDLHACASDEAVCDACSLDSDDPYDEPWPCLTARLVADHFGVAIPEGYFGSRPDVHPYEMPPEGFTPFVPPMPRWHTALDEVFDRELGD